MITETLVDVMRLAAFRGTVMRERSFTGPGALIAPVRASARGSSAPAGGRTSVKHNPAAIKDGAVSGLRLWRDPA